MLETPELFDVSRLHHGSPSIPKMHLEILKPFDTEESMLEAGIGLKKRDSHSLKQFSAHPIEPAAAPSSPRGCDPYNGWPTFGHLLCEVVAYGSYL